MDKSIEDPHITRTIAQQIEGEEEGFEHYATVKAEGNMSTPDEWGDTWRTFFIGAREGRLYVAERSSQAEGVHVHLLKDTQKVFEKIAARASHHWENVDIEMGARFEEMADEFEAPELLPDTEAA